MSAIALAVALAAWGIAALAVLADSALLSTHYVAVEDEPLGHRERTHRALLFARVLAQLTAGAAFGIVAGLAARSGFEAALLAVAIGAIAVALSETAAREIGDALGSVCLDRVWPAVRVADVVLWPVVWLGARADAMLLRLMPPPTQGEEQREVSAEQFRQVVAAEADVTGDEQRLLAGVFTLGDTEVHEIMVPRVDILGVEKETRWSEVVDRVRSAGHARLPVYDDTLDDVLGVLYAKDLLPAVIADEEPAGGWLALVRPAVFIPTTKRIDVQLRDFQSSRNHIAVVIDEYGGTAGIVTIEDVLEEIVGEIRDEHDDEEKPIESRDGRRYWVSGRVTVDELSEVLGEDLSHDDVTTVGGLVYELVGRVPRAGEQLRLGSFRIVVERVTRRRVERVYFERVAASAEAEDA